MYKAYKWGDGIEEGRGRKAKRKKGTNDAAILKTEGRARKKEEPRWDMQQQDLENESEVESDTTTTVSGVCDVGFLIYVTNRWGC